MRDTAIAEFLTPYAPVSGEEIRTVGGVGVGGSFGTDIQCPQGFTISAFGPNGLMWDPSNQSLNSSHCAAVADQRAREAANAQVQAQLAASQQALQLAQTQLQANQAQQQLAQQTQSAAQARLQSYSSSSQGAPLPPPTSSIPTASYDGTTSGATSGGAAATDVPATPADSGAQAASWQWWILGGAAAWLLFASGRGRTSRAAR